MSNGLKLGIVAVICLLVGGFLGHALSGKSGFGLGSTSCASITCLSGGLRLVSDAGGQFESDVAAVFSSTFTAIAGTFTGDLTVSGGTATVTTTNTATSTLIVGCMQTYATSTATPLKVQATTSSSGGTVLYTVFGSCPNL